MTNSRTIRRAVALAVLLHWLGWHARAWSQITGPAEIEMGQPLILESKAVAPAGGLIKHLWSGECKFIEADGGRLIYVWPPQPGVYDFGDMVATYAPAEKDGEVGTLTQTPYTHTVTVKSASPQPQPQPNVETLRSMVDDATAKELARMYAETATIVERGILKSVGPFRRYHADALAENKVESSSKVAVAIAKRLDALLDNLADDSPLPDTVLPAVKKLAEEFGGARPESPLTDKPTAAVYVYEKDNTVPPPPVLSAINKINRDTTAIATAIDDDIVDGTGDTPSQYEIPIAEAGKAGLPALVVMAGRTVLRVIKSPTTEAAVMEAVR